jgi:hypothetical protein
MKTMFLAVLTQTSPLVFQQRIVTCGRDDSIGIVEKRADRMGSCAGLFKSPVVPRGCPFSRVLRLSRVFSQRATKLWWEDPSTMVDEYLKELPNNCL